MSDIPIVVPVDYAFGDNVITIPAEHVHLVRTGLISDLRGVADEVCALLDARDRESDSMRERYDAAFARMEGARRLLDDIEWAAPAEPIDIEIDLGAHRSALRRGLLAQVEAERGLEASLKGERRGEVERRITALTLIEVAARPEGDA